MMFKAIIFALLCCQTICYLQQSVCTSVAFGKCTVGNYCGITDTGAYTCLPCPARNLCPGDGYTYSEQQLNKHLTNSSKYIIHKSNNSYIVSSNRKLFRKKLKRIVKIAKVGLKVAAIVKTGGTAGLAKLAAAKAKQMAIKKGLQCLKNGLSNFCNGKKKGIKLKVKPRIGSAGGLVKKTKLITQGNLRRGPKPSATKPTGVKTKPTFKPKPSKGNRKRPSKNVATKPPISNDDSVEPCSNIFDDFANKVNNVTNNVVKNPVNKGRDWLKRNIGGSRGNCNHKTGRKRPTNLRGKTKKPKSTIITKRRPTKPKSKPRSKIPTSNDDTANPPLSNDDTTNAPVLNDDSRPTIKTIPVTKSKPKSKAKISPITTRTPSTDDATMRPVRRPVRQTRRPTQVASSTDDNNPTPRPSRRRVKMPIKRPTVMPSQTFVVSDDNVPTPRPSRRRVRRTRRPAGFPLSIATLRPSAKRLVITNRPTRLPTTTMPTFVLTIGPTRRPTQLPTIRPTRIPTPVPSRSPTVKPTPLPSRSPTLRPTPIPSRAPTVRPSAMPTLLPSAAVAGPPTMIPGLSWSVFSSAPTVKSNIPPTLIPTMSMFSMITQIPTPRPSTHPTARSTPAPSLLKVIASQQASPTQRPNTEIPTAQPSVQPIITPSFRPTPLPSLQPVIPTLSPTPLAVGVSSINSSSNGQTSNSQMIIGVGVGCLILVIIIIVTCIFVSRKKQSPYQIWANHYSNKKNIQDSSIHTRDSMNEDIHHFYRRNQSPSPLQSSVFTPHVSSRQSFRNSQITYPTDYQKRLSFTRSPPQIYAI
jgi:hypothetical protein